MKASIDLQPEDVISVCVCVCVLRVHVCVWLLRCEGSASGYFGM